MESQLFVIRGFLDEAGCRAVRRAMDGGSSDAAEILDTDSGGGSGGDIVEADEVRRAASIDIAPDVLDRIERRLDGERATIGAFFDLTLTGREGAGFLRYHDGGFYRPHRDRAVIPAWPGAARRQVTVVVFLNAGGFTGGVLRVADIDVAPETGMLVAFPAGTVHEVTVVRGGTRDTVVDWFLGQ
jgi:predicted 2-oxoglutarate/Fe(II)-dependent dioxygenase YbiX